MPEMIDKPEELSDQFVSRIWSCYPQKAARIFGGTIVDYIAHLSKEGGELLSRVEYLKLLKRCVRITDSFLGCSRFSSRELLWGKPGLKKPGLLPKSSNRIIKFFFRRVLAIIFGFLGSIVVILQFFKILDITQLPHHITWGWTIFTAIAVFIVLIGFRKWICYEWADFDSGKVGSEIDNDEAEQIYKSFEAYNEELKKRVSRGYPVARVFVLTREQITEDDEVINKRVGKSWWQIMVEEHARFGIDVARMCLTPGLAQRHAGLFIDQFSVFVRHGEGGWIVVEKERGDGSKQHPKSIPKVVTVCYLGSDAFRRYGGMCGEIREQNHRFTADPFKESSEGLQDFALCAECSPERGHIECDRKDCPGWAESQKRSSS